MGDMNRIHETRVRRAIAKALAESVILHETLMTVTYPPESWAQQLAAVLAPIVARDLNDDSQDEVLVGY